MSIPWQEGKWAGGPGPSQTRRLVSLWFAETERREKDDARNRMPPGAGEG